MKKCNKLEGNGFQTLFEQYRSNNRIFYNQYIKRCLITAKEYSDNMIMCSPSPIKIQISNCKIYEYICKNTTQTHCNFVSMMCIYYKKLFLA